MKEIKNQNGKSLMAYEKGDVGRKMAFILWVDSETYNFEDILNSLQTYATETGAIALWILHDKDTKKDGSLQKKHYHCVLKFVNNRSAFNVAKNLGIDMDKTPLVEYDDFEKTLLYLLHYEN